MVTLKDVAKRANVSKMTVSRVINHPDLVTDELKQLVHKAMKELGYKPNPAARALAQNKTRIIKVLILEEMDSTEPYYMHLISGIAKALDAYQYALQLVTENTVDLGGCDGYIITGMKRDDYEWVQALKQPIIIFGENDIQLPFVDSDNEGGVQRMTKLAYDKGYDHFAYIGIDVPELFAYSRLKGFEKALAGQPYESKRRYNIKNSSTIAEAFIETLDIANNTCFICATDRIALGVQRAIKNKFSHLEKIGISGFDGVFLDQIASPKLTTVKQNVSEMGKMCVELLMQQIDGKPLTTTANYFDAQIVDRGTV